MSQGKLNGSQIQPDFGRAISQQGMSPTPHQSTVGQFGNAFGQPGAVQPPASTGYVPQAQPVEPGQIDRSLVNGPGPDPRAIGPVSPVTQDQLNGLPGPDGQQFGFNPFSQIKQ